MVYFQNIFGRSSYNLPYTVSHISCFLQGESQVQPPKYKIQTQTHIHKYIRLSFKSQIVSTKSTGDQHGHRAKSEAKLLATTSNASLSPRCHSCRGPCRSSCQVASLVLAYSDYSWLDHQSSMNMLPNDDLLHYHFLNHR